MSNLHQIVNSTLEGLEDLTIEQLYTDSTWSFLVQLNGVNQIFPGYYDHDLKYEPAADILYLQAMCDRSTVVWALPLEEGGAAYAATINAVMQTVIDTQHKVQFSLDNQEFLFSVGSWYPVKSIVDKGSDYEIQGFGMSGTVRVPKEKTILEDMALNESATAVATLPGIKNKVTPAPKPAYMKSESLPTDKTSRFAASTYKDVIPEVSTVIANTAAVNPDIRQYMSSNFHVLSTKNTVDWETSIAGRDMAKFSVPGCANRASAIGEVSWVQVTDHLNQRLYIAHAEDLKLMKNWNRFMSLPFGSAIGLFITSHYLILEFPSYNLSLECNPVKLTVETDFEQGATVFSLPVVDGKTLDRNWPDLPVSKRDLIGSNLKIRVCSEDIGILDSAERIIASIPLLNQ